MKTLAIVAACGLMAGPVFGGTDNRLIAHEWGTFTSLSGADGVRIPVIIELGENLPPWVRAQREGKEWSNADDMMNVKLSTVALERMETPVIYFYSDAPTTVDVAVNFPKGLVTEVFPPVTAFTPLSVNPEHNRMVPDGGSTVRWSHVAIDGKTNARPVGLLDAGKSHYGAARDTDSSLIHTPALDGNTTEKFLFYRGVADCDLGVSAKAVGGDKFILNRVDKGAAGTVFVLERAGGRVRYAKYDNAKSGTQLALPASAGDEAKVGAEFAAALTGAGLYEREATAMVNTWKSLWFGEEGTRVMVILPQATIDSVLPLTITPTPDSVKRVFVARLEMLTPEREESIRQEILKMPPNQLGGFSKETESLGRFMWAAVEYVRGHTKNSTAK